MRNKNLEEKIKNFIFDGNIEDFVSIQNTNFSYDAVRKMVLFDRKNNKIFTMRILHAGKVTVETELFKKDTIKVYPYRKNSRKFIICPLSSTYAAILKLKIKKLGIKSFVLKRQYVLLQYGEKRRKYYGYKAEKRNKYVLTINDPADFGVFCVHFSNLIQDKKYTL
jgi:hypothetical protein